MSMTVVDRSRKTHFNGFSLIACLTDNEGNKFSDDYASRYIHRVSKNVPPTTCYNLVIIFQRICLVLSTNLALYNFFYLFDIHEPITTIFGRSVTEKV